jgi:hypothetical protein
MDERGKKYNCREHFATKDSQSETDFLSFVQPAVVEADMVLVVTGETLYLRKIRFFNGN